MNFTCKAYSQGDDRTLLCWKDPTNGLCYPITKHNMNLWTILCVWTFPNFLVCIILILVLCRLKNLRSTLLKQSLLKSMSWPMVLGEPGTKPKFWLLCPLFHLPDLFRPGQQQRPQQIPISLIQTSLLSCSGMDNSPCTTCHSPCPTASTHSSTWLCQ